MTEFRLRFNQKYAKTSNTNLSKLLQEAASFEFLLFPHKTFKTDSVNLSKLRFTVVQSARSHLFIRDGLAFLLLRERVFVFYCLEELKIKKLSKYFSSPPPFDFTHHQDGDDDDEDWAEETTEEAQRRRMEEISDHAKNLTLSEDLEKPLEERVNLFYNFVKVRFSWLMIRCPTSFCFLFLFTDVAVMRQNSTVLVDFRVLTASLQPVLTIFYLVITELALI